MTTSIVSLRIRPKRVRYPYGEGQPTTTQVLEWYDPNALHTKAYERRLIVQLVNSTISDVVAKEDVCYDALLDILDHQVATTWPGRVSRRSQPSVLTRSRSPKGIAPSWRR